MALLSDIARRRKIRYFLDGVPGDASILEIGSGSGWVGDYLRQNGWTGYVGLDVVPPADIVGDVRDWQQLGLPPSSFDVIVAFEVVEHVDCWHACHALLKPGGRMLVTTPLPHRDWVLKMLESRRLNQRRTSPHDHLVYLHEVRNFRQRQVQVVAGLSQWGVFTK
ncbi:MAG TPA: class I SAM-dependent methyltransferase [Candidatus Eisenbacteria bacterium]|nr:class I SAM-dependent methyltransferase [Candidatus Eisenbacteria bacterium]